MAKKQISDIYPNDDGSGYTILYCDGTEGQLASLCCDDEPTLPPAGNPDTNSGVRCDLAYRFAAIFHGSLLNNTVNIFPLDLPLIPFAVQAYMLQYGIPVQYYPSLLAWVIRHIGHGQYITEFWQFDQPESLNAIMCCVSDLTGFPDSFVDCYVDTFSALTALNEPYISLVKEFIKIFTPEYRANRVATTEITPPTSPTLCGDCDPETTPTLGCSEENTPFQQKFTHLDSELIGDRACYPANQYSSCSTPENGGYNSVNVTSIRVVFGQAICIRRVAFNFAGNSQVNWLSVDVIAKQGSNEYLLASNIAVVGRTNCQAGLPVSFDMSFPEPAVGTELLIRPNRTAGAAGAAGKIHCHCVTVYGGTVPTS